MVKHFPLWSILKLEEPEVSHEEQILKFVSQVKQFKSPLHLVHISLEVSQ